MFVHIMKDLNLNIPINKVLALPNISKKYISTLTTSKLLLEAKLGKNALDICLFRDQIKINTNNENERKELLLEWWKCNISKTPGFRNVDEYKQIIGRYVGLMSTVKIRTLGDVITEEGYQNMRIILTPEQVEILRSNERKVYIQGSFGTGKTILLILKARQMVREGESVLMVCGRSTKQLMHLVACVKADMTEEQKKLVHYITEYKTLHSLDFSIKYNIFVDECYILALPYIIHDSGENNKLCWLAGRCVPDVNEFSVKQLIKELRSPETVKSVGDKLNEDFMYDFMKSGDFPVIDHLSHANSEEKKYHENASIFNGSTIWRCEQCWEDIIDVFVDMKLIKKNQVKPDSQPVAIAGSDPHGQTKQRIKEACGHKGHEFNQIKTSEEKLLAHSSRQTEEASKDKIPDNAQTNELKALIEHHSAIAWSDIAILLPHFSFITNRDTDAIDQISDKYGVPFNYFFLRENETVQNKVDAHGWTESDDEDLLLGKKNEVIICASSQFLGLEKKVIIVAGWENITTNVEMSDCQPWISLLDLTNILTVYNSPKGMTVNTLDDLANKAKIHILSEMVKKRFIFSQSILLLADTCLADCNNKCHFNDIAQTFLLKLVKITNNMENFEPSLVKFKEDLDRFFTKMEKDFKARFSRYSDQFGQSVSWKAFQRLISVLLETPAVVNDAKMSKAAAERDGKSSKASNGNVKTSHMTKGDAETSDLSNESDLLKTIETFVLEIFVPEIKSLLTVDDSDSIPPTSESNPLNLMMDTVLNLFLSTCLTKVKDGTQSNEPSNPPESDMQPELLYIVEQLKGLLQNTILDENMQDQFKPDETVLSSESSQLMDSSGLPGTSVSNTDSTVEQSFKSTIQEVISTLLDIISSEEITKLFEEKYLRPNESAKTNSVSSSTTGSKTAAECLDASEETTRSSESPEPNDLIEKSDTSSINTDSKQTDNCLGIESLSAKLKDMSEQFFTALRLALQTHISVSCNLSIKDASGKELVNDFEQSERSNEAKQSNESSCSDESTRSDKSTLPNESSRLDESTPSNESKMSKEVNRLDESITSKESTRSKEETSLDKLVHSTSNRGTQANETYISIDIAIDVPMPSTANGMVQLLFAAVSGAPILMLSYTMDELIDSQQATQSDISTQSIESTQLDESTRSKESTQSNKSTQSSSKTDSQILLVPSNIKLKLKGNHLIIDLPMPTNFQNEKTKTFFKCFRSFDFKLNKKHFQKCVNILDGKNMESYLRNYFRLTDSFSSTGILKNISTWFVKMVFFYSAISRSTSRVFIWSKK